MSRFRTMSIAALALGTVLGAVACSSDDSDPTTTTTEKTTTTAESAAEIRFDKSIQQELADVGCFPGAVDGVIGPKTDAAIVEFQEYAGLEADGELGPETEAALKKAAADGTKVCDANTTTTTPGSTTTTAKPSTPPCTATALLEGIGGDPSTSIASFVCSGGYAAGTLGGGGDTHFILVAEGGYWTRPAQDPCGSASAGLPPVILTDGCPD